MKYILICLYCKISSMTRSYHTFSCNYYSVLGYWYIASNSRRTIVTYRLKILNTPTEFITIT